MPWSAEWADLARLIESFEPANSYADDLLVLALILLGMLLNVIVKRKNRERRRRIHAARANRLLEDISPLVQPFGAWRVEAEWFNSRPLVVLTVHFPEGAISFGGVGFDARDAAAAILEEYRTSVFTDEKDEEVVHPDPEQPETGSDRDQDEPDQPQAVQKKPWWAVLGVSRDATQQEVQRAYRTLALKNHPDHGGSSEEMAALNAARDEAKAALT